MDVESPYIRGGGGPPHPPRYVMLSENGDKNLRPPPYHRNIPRYHSNSKRHKCSCCKCICCCCCFLFLFFFSLFALVFCLYILYQPKIPSYNVEHLDITKFHVDDSYSLYTEFTVTVRAENPNEKISIIYGKKSHIEVTYLDSILCSGKLPAFHQGHKNTTVMKVVLKGKSEFGSGLQAALMDNRKKNRIPLDIFVKAPIILVFGSLQTMEVKVLVECNLIVNSLSPNEQIKILSSHYKVKVEI